MKQKTQFKDWTANPHHQQVNNKVTIPPFPFTPQQSGHLE